METNKKLEEYRVGVFLDYSDSERNWTWEWKQDAKQKYSDVLDEFDVSVRKYDIALVSTEKNEINFFARFKKGQKVATKKVRISIEEIFELSDPIKVDTLLENINPKSRNAFIERPKLSANRLTAAFWNDFMLFLQKRHTEYHEAIIYLINKIKDDKIVVSDNRIQNIIQEKDAINLALRIGDLRNFTNQFVKWDIKADNTPAFLRNIDSVAMREDQMIINDFRCFGDWSILQEFKNNVAVFSDGKKKISIMNANRTRIENIIGVDLIYYNHNEESYIFVQYKRLLNESQDWRYRPLNDRSLYQELKRMNKYLELIEETPESNTIENYRYNKEPFYFKFSQDVQDLYTNDLCKGIYITKSYFDLLLNSELTTGPQGGKYFSYTNVKNYFNNTLFISLVQSGLIGTKIRSSKLISEILYNSIKDGKSIILASSENRQRTA